MLFMLCRNHYLQIKTFQLLCDISKPQTLACYHVSILANSFVLICLFIGLVVCLFVLFTCLYVQYRIILVRAANITNLTSQNFDFGPIYIYHDRSYVSSFAPKRTKTEFSSVHVVQLYGQRRWFEPFNYRMMLHFLQ